MVKLRKSLSAGYGFNAWLQQRLTAVVMLLSIVLFIALFALAGRLLNSDITSWQQYFNYTVVKIVAQITVLAVVLHAWVGMRDLVMDYVKSYSFRITRYLAILLWLFGSTIYSFYVFW